ncbi:MAG: helix-hairpin-helix domain-containing protein, partial [Lactobacillaceae bacterium]|nr:helix-hairpin-helix domain-containing protein [Lactobacillaceae bacterium]
NKQINKASTVQSANSSITNKEFFVDIKGEVLQPQVLKLSKKLIIQEVIELAGGLTENADTSQLNLSAEVSNGQMILIPNKNKIENNDENVNNEFRKININTANLNELQNIPGIGEIKAKLILDYRLKKGLFKSINDLSNISGFGEKTISRLSEYISV